MTRLSILRRLSAPIYVGFAVLATLPFILLTSASPWLFACFFFLAGVLVFLAPKPNHPDRRRRVFLTSALLVAAGFVLLLVDATGVLDPLVDPVGDLILSVAAEAEPREVRRGDEITYRLTATNDQTEVAMPRRFEVDGQPFRGALMYLELPTENGIGLPIVSVSASAEGIAAQPTVVYAQDEPLLPIFWHWTTTYEPGHRIVGLLSGDGHDPGEWGVGGSLSLDVTVRVPMSFAADTVRAIRCVLSYEDPQIGAFVAQTLWNDPPPRVRVIE